MRTIDCIVQEGVVEQVSEGCVIVSIEKYSACSTCHARGTCTSFDVSDSEIKIRTNNKSFAPGDKVLLKMSKSIGIKAVFIGYGLPFLTFLFTLILFFKLFNSEVIAAAGAILILVIYYVSLKLFSSKIQSSFNIEIETLN